MLTFICYMSLFQVLQLHSFCFINGLSPQPCLHLPRFGGGEKKKEKKGQTENSFLQLSGLVQLRQRQCWLQHALPTGFWAFILFLFFCKQFHTEVLHAEWDQTGLKHLPWGRLAGFMSKPTALEAASHGFLACSLTQIYSPCIHTPPKSWSSPTSGAAQITKLHSYKEEVWTQALFFFFL